MNTDKQPNFDEWCKRDRWAIVEGAMLLLEKEWDGTYSPRLPAGLSQRFNQVIRAACDDLGRSLPTEFESKFSVIPGSVPDNPFILVRPGDFIHWAKGRHFSIPLKLRRAAIKAAAKNPASTAKNKRAGRTPRRTPAFQRAVMAAANKLDAMFPGKLRTAEWISEHRDLVGYVQAADNSFSWFGENINKHALPYSKRFGIEQRYIKTLIQRARRER